MSSREAKSNKCAKIIHKVTFIVFHAPKTFLVTSQVLRTATAHTITHNSNLPLSYTQPQRPTQRGKKERKKVQTNKQSGFFLKVCMHAALARLANYYILGLYKATTNYKILLFLSVQ